MPGVDSREPLSLRRSCRRRSVTRVVGPYEYAMRPSIKRNALLVILAVIFPWVAITLCNVVASQRGGIYEVTRDWYVHGIGGRYGAVEREASKQVDHRTQHVAYETEFLCGPIRFSFPFSAPLAVGGLALWIGAPVAVVLLLRFRNHETRDTRAAQQAGRTEPGGLASVSSRSPQAPGR